MPQHSRDDFKGFSIVEILIALGILSAVILASLNYFITQMRSNNFLEFQGKREQLRLAIIGQVLNDPNNCKCLFNGGTFTSPGPSNLTGVAPTAIGRYQFGTPGDCSTVTMPLPLVNSTGIDNVQATSIRLENIVGTPGSYTGVLTIDLRSIKEVQGPKDITLNFTVDVQGAGPSPVTFQGCSSSSSSSAVTPALGLCPAGQFVTGYDPTGALQCGPPTYQ